MSNYPAGAEHDPNAPYNQVDKDNKCLYCDEKVEYLFCDVNCEKAYLND